MTRRPRAAWLTERRWLALMPVWFLHLYAVQLARLTGVPWEHEEFTRRLLAARRTEGKGNGVS